MLRTQSPAPWLIVEPVTVRAEAARDAMSEADYAALLRSIISAGAACATVSSLGE